MATSLHGPYPDDDTGSGEKPTTMAIDTTRAAHLTEVLGREASALEAPPVDLPAPTVGWEDFRRALSDALAAHNRLRNGLSDTCRRTAAAMDSAVAGVVRCDAELARRLNGLSSG